MSGFSDSGDRLFLDNIRVDADCLCDGIANAGMDAMICHGDTTQLMGGIGDMYLWSPATNLSDPTLPNPLAYPTETTTYTLTVTDTDEVTIIVNDNVSSSVAQVMPDLCQDGSGEANVEITEGLGPFTISWQAEDGTEQGSANLSDLGC